MKSLINNLRGFGPRKLAILGGVFVGMLGLLGALFASDTRSGPDTLLYGELDPKEASLMVERLDKAQIRYRLQDQGQAIFVSTDKVASARLLLAKDGLPSGGSIGYELFDKASNLTQTQFQQSINETRALEGELSRSIRLLAGVRAARVHLVLPKREIFSNGTRSAQASVLLTIEPGARINEQSVAAIANLVAAAVPGLQAQDISIVDNHGDVLAKPVGKAASYAGFQNTEAQRLEIEHHLGQSIEDMLGAIVGEGQVHAQVSVELDTGHMHEIQEKFDPEQQVLRSQQTTSEKHVDMKAPSNASVGNNLPNASLGSSQDGSQSSRQLETDTYEVGKIVRTLEQDQPRIARVSVSVVVNALSETNEGKVIWKQRDAGEIERLTEVVKNAVGYDPHRGDSVSVISMKFVSTVHYDTSENNSPSRINSEFHFGSEATYGRLAGFLVFLVSVGLFVLRPLLTKRGELAEPATEDPQISVSPGQGANAANENGWLSRPVDTSEATEDALINVDGIEGQVRASSIQRVLDFVENQPDQSIGRLRAWVSADTLELDHA